MGVGELRWRGVRGFLQSRFRGIFAVSDTFSGRDAILKLPTWISWPKPFEQKKSRPKILSNSVARVDWSRRSHFESQNVTSLIVTSMTLTAVDCTSRLSWISNCPYYSRYQNTKASAVNWKQSKFQVLTLSERGAICIWSSRTEKQ